MNPTDQVLLTLVKWAVPPVVLGLCAAIAALWNRLNRVTDKTVTDYYESQIELHKLLERFTIRLEVQPREGPNAAAEPGASRGPQG